MADRNSAGPTTLADIRDLTTPAAAPRTFRLSGAMAAQFEMLYRNSFPNRHAKEQGGTIVADAHGNLSLQNPGGMGSTSGTFAANVMLKDPVRFKVVGVFHTHPYDHQEGSMHGVAFSGADAGSLILTDTILSIVQSGPRLFVYVKTALTPKYVDYGLTRDGADAELAMRVKAGQTFQQASRIIAGGLAVRYGLAYYQGGHGTATRI